MKKLIIVFGLLVASPVLASECLFGTQFRENPLVKVTKEEIQSFSRHLSMAVNFGEKMVAVKEIPDTNPMHMILCQLFNDLSVHDGDIVKMISSDQELTDRIRAHQEVDKHPMVQFGLEQIRNKVGKIEDAQKFVIRFRSLSSDLKLSEKYPVYSNPWIGEIQTQERINFMLRNAEYPLYNPDAVKDYTAMFIYQLLFAQKTD